MSNNSIFFDFNHLNEKMCVENISIDKRLAFIHEQMGGEFYDEDKKIMKESVLRVISLGGFPLSRNGNLFTLNNSIITEDIVKKNILSMAGISSFMSYLNSNNLDINKLGDVVVNKYKHLSVLHTFNISILISGITSACEHELSCQRDLVHLSRVTVAKTKAQISPCIVCNDEKLASIYEKILINTENILNESKVDDLEKRNILFPSAKSSAILLTGSLRNFIKIVELANSGGKEDEFLNVLMKIKKIIKTFVDI